MYENENGEEATESDIPESDQNAKVTYQASSPDEVALVEWSGSVGLKLAARTLSELTLKAPQGTTLGYDILQVFPFTSETKRMGIIVRDKSTGEILFYMKGVDVVMSTIVQYNDWLMEEIDNMDLAPS